MSFFAFILFVVVIIMRTRSGRRPVQTAPREDDRIAQLSERVRTLESIILDRDRRLRREIDRLG
ncbi:MAG: hypothetical protein VYC38_04135 [Pseudomonadota bacterium]|nr:hypothetical protein [Pseudomonadota bacterium]